jgi:hypothetical protein
MMDRINGKDIDGADYSRLFCEKVHPDDYEEISIDEGVGDYAGRVGIFTKGVWLTKEECKDLINVLQNWVENRL